jgi:hypothetical protein
MARISFFGFHRFERELQNLCREFHGFTRIGNEKSAKIRVICGKNPAYRFSSR